MVLLEKLQLNKSYLWKLASSPQTECRPEPCSGPWLNGRGPDRWWPDKIRELASPPDDEDTSAEDSKMMRSMVDCLESRLYGLNRIILELKLVEQVFKIYSFICHEDYKRVVKSFQGI